MWYTTKYNKNTRRIRLPAAKRSQNKATNPARHPVHFSLDINLELHNNSVTTVTGSVAERSKALV